MSKYEPLRAHLAEADPGLVSMTFAEVARIVDGLPPSAYNHRAWWSNNPKTSAPRSGWLAAGRRIDRVDLNTQTVTFGAAGAVTAPPRTPSTRPSRRVDPVLHTPDPVSLTDQQRIGLEAFLTFRGESRQLRYRIGEIERSVSGLTAPDAVEAAHKWGVTPQLLDGARLAKQVAAQVDVVLHAAGIVHALPHILEPDEVVEYVSLGAGNTGRDFDLETDRQVAEFKFINWAGGAETVRQDTLLIDIFHLASADTAKRRVMYVTGAAVPLRWLAGSKRVTRDCLARKRRIPDRFDAIHGPDAHHYVRDYWAAISASGAAVEVVDLLPVVPGLTAVAFDESEST